MNVLNLCESTDILIPLKMKCNIQFRFALLNISFHLSPHENMYHSTSTH